MVSSQATTDQTDSPSLHTSSTLESSGPLLGVSGSASSTYGDVLLQSQSASSQYAPGASTEHVSSPSVISYQPAGDKGSLSINPSGSESSFPLQSSGAAVHVYSSESLSSSPSIATQGSTFTSQGSPITEQVINSGPVIVTTQEVSSGSIGYPSQNISSQYSPGSLTPSKLGSLSLGVSSQSTSDQSLYMSSAPSRSVMTLASSSHYVPVQTGSSSRDLSSPKPQGTSAVYAPSSPSKYLNVAASSPQSVSIQSGSNQHFRWLVAQVGTQAGASSQFMSSQGGSSSYSGALSLPQSSPSKYSSGALKPTSPQTVSRPLTSVASSSGSSGAPFGASNQSASQGMSSSFSGSMQSLGTSSQYGPSSPTFSKFSSSRLLSSQSTSDPGMYSQVPSTSQIGSWPQSGVSSQFVPSQDGSSSYSGSLPQSQGSLGQYAPAFPSEYVNAPLASQGLASQGMSSSFCGSAQGTFSRPASSSPTFSKFSSSRQVYSQSTSDPGLYGQLSATSQFGSLPQKGTSPQLLQAASVFNSGSLPQSQGSLGQYAPAFSSEYLNTPLASQGFATQSATKSSRRGLTTLLDGSQSGTSLTLQGSGSSFMPQGSMSPIVSGSPSQYSSASLSSTQSVAGQFSPASQRVYSVSQRPHRLEPSASSWTQGIQSSGAALSQGNYQSQSSQVHSRFSSPLSEGDSAYQSNLPALSGGSGQFVSSQRGSGSYSGISLQSPSTSTLYPLGSPGYAKLGFSQSATGQRPSLYGSTPQTGSGAQLSSSRYASLQGGSSAVVGSSQYSLVSLPLDAKAALYVSRPSAASLTQGIQTSDTASSQSTSSAQMSSGFSSSLSALSQNVAPVAQSGLTSAVRRSQSLLGGVQRQSRLSSSFRAPSGSTINGQMSERFTSHHAADSSLPPSSGLSAPLSSRDMFSGSSLPQTAQTLSEYGSQSHNQESTASVANYAFQMFSGNYGQDASVKKSTAPLDDITVKG
ncbi:uncharacterized protein LOC130550446 [Triplophysa rosa]|uniref:uncharacterized protein LOC130550446 n=1 Tax=Triplophysa rosa TaxID=992332 RepID=UPI002545F9E9|nr:uncharacterized protein LOC130550446 [Triplophysa rosa]